MPTADVCRKHGLSLGTFYKFKSQYGGMEVSDAAKLRATTDENAKLKRLLSDTFGASRKFRILAVNDDCCRENLCLMADTSISGARVARELDALVRVYGKPASIVRDNGTEFTSRVILKWANENDIEWHYIDPGAAAERVH